VNELSATGGGQGVWMRCSMRRGDADKEKAKSGEEGGVKKRRFLGNQPAVNICIAEQNTHTHTHTHTHCA
jgi:hypothetical protein